MILTVGRPNQTGSKFFCVGSELAGSYLATLASRDPRGLITSIKSSRMPDQVGEILKLMLVLLFKPSGTLSRIRTVIA